MKRFWRVALAVLSTGFLVLHSLIKVKPPVVEPENFRRLSSLKPGYIDLRDRTEALRLLQEAAEENPTASRSVGAGGALQDLFNPQRLTTEVWERSLELAQAISQPELDHVVEWRQMNPESLTAVNYLSYGKTYPVFMPPVDIKRLAVVDSLLPLQPEQLARDMYPLDPDGSVVDLSSIHSYDIPGYGTTLYIEVWPRDSEKCAPPGCPLVVFFIGGDEGADLSNLTFPLSGSLNCKDRSTLQDEICNIFVHPMGTWLAVKEQLNDLGVVVLAPMIRRPHMWSGMVDFSELLVAPLVQHVLSKTQGNGMIVDPMRVHATGLSDGGFGAMQAALRHPHIFSFAIAFALGYSDAYMNMSWLPVDASAERKLREVVIVQGSLDMPPWTRSFRSLQHLQRLLHENKDTKITYRIWPNEKHYTWFRGYVGARHHLWLGCLLPWEDDRASPKLSDQCAGRISDSRKILALVTLGIIAMAAALFFYREWTRGSKPCSKCPGRSPKIFPTTVLMANNNIEERGDSGESDQRSPSGNAVQGIQIPWDGPRFLHHAGNPALPETDVMELIRQQARRTPLAAAVETDGGHVWNYRELGFRVCALAQRLDEEAPVPAESDASGLRCGSLSKGGAEGLMCILGVLYAGRCLLPLDIKCPDSRLSYLVEDAKLRVAVVDSNSFGIDHARDLGIRMIVEVTDIASPQWKRQRCELDWLSRSNVPVRRIGEAYMNYTSGTTGKPKSIVSMHRSVLSHSLAAAKVLDARQQDCCLFQSPPMYGFHMCQLYPYLQIGARVALPLTSVSQTPLRIWEGPPTKAGVSVAAFVPSVLDPQLGGAAMHIPKSVRRIKCSGEALGGATVSSTIALHKKLSMVNWWGNTECLGCTAVLMEPSAAKWLTEGAKGLPEVSGRCPPISQAVPVGLPVGWRTLHLLPAEVAGKMLRKDEGEACVTGPAVCPPYAGRPKEAAAAFADSAFGPGNVLRTGDILLRSEVPEAFAPYSLRYVGRKDFQIKINGIRIELGEIEEVAMELQAVERCIVKLHASELDGQLVKQLVAFYVGKEVPEADVQAHIAQKVPKAMVPHQVVFLKEFPSNNASKIDRAALIPPAVKQKGLAVMDSLGLQRVIASRDEVWAHHATQAMYSLVPFCLLYAHWLPFNLSDVTAETDTHVLEFLQFLHHIRILNVASLFMGMSDKTARKSYSPIKSFFMVAFLYFYQAWPRIVPGAGGFATLHRWTFLAILIYKVLIFCLERIRVPMPRACLSPRISNICARVGWNALQQQKGSVLWFPVPPSLVVFVVACIAPIWGSVPLNMWEGHGAVSIWPERLTSNAKRLTDGDQMLPYIEKAFYGSPNGTLGSWIVLFANYFAGFHYGVPFYCKHREMMTNLENRGRAHVIAVRTAAFVAAAGLAWMRELVDVPVLPAFERFNVSMTMWDWPNYFDGFYPLRFLAEWLFALLLTTALADGAWAWNLVGRNLLFTYLGHMIVMFDMPALLDALAPAGVIVQFLVILMLPYMYSLSVGALLFEVVAQCSIFLSKRRLLSRLITGLLVAVWLGLVLGALYVNRT